MMHSPLEVERLVRRGAHAVFTDEYNCRLRRLFPWPSQVETRRPITEFGAIWVVVDCATDVEQHEHDEEETFIVIEGQAELTVNGRSTMLGRGDVAYIPRFARHGLRNLSTKVPFVMVDIYWDWRGRQKSESPQ